MHSERESSPQVALPEYQQVRTPQSDAIAAGDIQKSQLCIPVGYRRQLNQADNNGACCRTIHLPHATCVEGILMMSRQHLAA